MLIVDVIGFCLISAVTGFIGGMLGYYTAERIRMEVDQQKLREFRARTAS
jgi:hypothetical protein